MHNPTLIPALLRDTSVNNGFIYRELRKALPCRIGIEFEMGKLFLDGFKKKYNMDADDDSITAFYKVFNFFIRIIYFRIANFIILFCVIRI